MRRAPGYVTEVAFSVHKVDVILLTQKMTGLDGIVIVAILVGETVHLERSDASQVNQGRAFKKPD